MGSDRKKPLRYFNEPEVDAVENNEMYIKYGTRRGHDKGIAQVKKNAPRHIAIVKVWHRTTNVCNLRSRRMFRGAQ